MFRLITGGSGSGKSEYAESEVERLAHLTESEEKYYIATMFPYGEETLQKIRRHQQMRQVLTIWMIQLTARISLMRILYTKNRKDYIKWQTTQQIRAVTQKQSRLSDGHLESC